MENENFFHCYLIILFSISNNRPDPHKDRDNAETEEERPLIMLNIVEEKKEQITKEITAEDEYNAPDKRIYKIENYELLRSKSTRTQSNQGWNTQTVQKAESEKNLILMVLDEVMNLI